MLEQIDLSLKLTKEQFKSYTDEVSGHLGDLQQQCRASGIPIIIVFEGWDASGKGTNINRLMRILDPRGFKVHSFEETSEEALLRPYLWRSWIRTPHRGYIKIFDQSWYQRVLHDSVEDIASTATINENFNEIINFERLLTDDGFLLIKFWLHISKKEQKKRLKKMEEDPMESWKVTPEDWKRHRKYENYLSAAESMLQKTSTANATWTIVEAEDKYFGSLKIFETVVRAMESAISSMSDRKQKAPKSVTASNQKGLLNKTLQLESKAFLAQYDLNQTTSAEEYKETIDDLQKKLLDVQHRLYLDHRAAVIVFEGWDAAGKGGAIKRLLEPLDPRGFEVFTTSAPTSQEFEHHYLWRFWNAIPRLGHITIYDRSWYGRVLVERVEALCHPNEWQRAYREINEFEQCLANAGIILIKFWLQISADEQILRFKAREADPYKKWKITKDDYRNRDKWDHYEMAVAEMIKKTSTTCAPWTIVESNNKYYSRLKVIETVYRTVSAALGSKRKTKNSP